MGAFREVKSSLTAAFQKYQLGLQRELNVIAQPVIEINRWCLD